MPFVLPMKTDKLEDGFVISMCNLQDQGGLISVGDIQGTVEEVAGVVRPWTNECGTGVTIRNAQLGSSECAMCLHGRATSSLFASTLGMDARLMPGGPRIANGA